MTGIQPAVALLLAPQGDTQGEEQHVELIAPSYVYGLVAFGLLLALLLMTLSVGKGRPHA